MRLALVVLAVALTSCSSTRPPADPVAARLDHHAPRLIEAYGIAGIGVGVLRDGDLAWTRYYGEQRPGVPASAETVFNTASVSKTVTAEAFLALDEAGLFGLDDPIAPYVRHPDLADDPRYDLLTPRILLSHRSGLLNWPHSYDDGRLAFVRDPGTAYGYSGAGVELAVRAAEARLGQDYEAVLREHVFGPAGVREMGMGVEDWLDGRLATPMDEGGVYRPVAELNPNLTPGAPGDWNGADDLLTTVEAYATLLAHVLDDGPRAAARTTVLTSLDGDPIYDCEPTPAVRCPDAYGHSVGWMAYDYGDHTVLLHAGSDAGEQALVYGSPETGDGAVIFVNGAAGFLAVAQILDLLGQEPAFSAYYRQLIDRVLGVDLESLREG